MIPTELTFSIFFTLFVIICYVFDLISIITNKQCRLFATIILNCVLSGCWGYVMCKGMNDVIMRDFLIATIIVFGTCLLTIFSWNPNQHTNDEMKETIYTVETLIGQSGVISHHYSDKKYLGYLNDQTNSSIIVRIDDDFVRSGDKFIIDHIDGCDIIAKII